MNGATRVILLFFLAFALAFRVGAQVVTAQVSSRQVQVGVPFEYAIVINSNPSGYSPPSFKGFDVVGGPNQSSSMQWVNGQTSTQLTLSWALTAQKEGKYPISGAFVMVGGQRYDIPAITMEVTKGAAGQGQSSGGQADQKFNNVNGTDHFIRTSVSKNTCYLGEQITIIQKVYSRNQIIGYKKPMASSYDGFYSQQLESPTKGQLVPENVDGVTYYTHEAMRTLATANQAGKIVLAPAEAEVVVRRQTNAKPKNIFEQFFGAQSYEDVPVSVKSKAITIEVLPLPENGKPESFNGAVGNFSSKVEATRRELKANDAFNLKITISGKGNIKLINAPALKLPEGFESYEPKISEGQNSKSFDYLIIPRNEGDYTIESIDFSYFNLETKKYVTIPSGPIKIKVLPPDPNSTGAQVYTPHSQVKETENDIRYIKKGTFTLLKTETEFFNSPAHLSFLAFPVLGLIAGLFFHRNHIKNNSDLAQVRERKAARMAKKQLVNAEKLMGQNRKDEFYTEILNALNNYLGHKLNIPVADLSREAIQKVLQQRQTDEVILNKLLTTIETGEYAKYAPGAVSGDLQKVYKDTVELITGLEQQLNKKA